MKLSNPSYLLLGVTLITINQASKSERLPPILHKSQRFTRALRERQRIKALQSDKPEGISSGNDSTSTNYDLTPIISPNPNDSNPTKDATTMSPAEFLGDGRSGSDQPTQSTSPQGTSSSSALSVPSSATSIPKNVTKRGFEASTIIKYLDEAQTAIRDSNHSTWNFEHSHRMGQLEFSFTRNEEEKDWIDVTVNNNTVTNLIVSVTFAMSKDPMPKVVDFIQGEVLRPRTVCVPLGETVRICLHHTDRFLPVTNANHHLYFVAQITPATNVMTEQSSMTPSKAFRKAPETTADEMSLSEDGEIVSTDITLSPSTMSDPVTQLGPIKFFSYTNIAPIKRVVLERRPNDAWEKQRFSHRDLYGNLWDVNFGVSSEIINATIILRERPKIDEFVVNIGLFANERDIKSSDQLRDALMIHQSHAYFSKSKFAHTVEFCHVKHFSKMALNIAKVPFIFAAIGIHKLEGIYPKRSPSSKEVTSSLSGLKTGSFNYGSSTSPFPTRTQRGSSDAEIRKKELAKSTIFLQGTSSGDSRRGSNEDTFSVIAATSEQEEEHQETETLSDTESLP